MVRGVSDPTHVKFFNLRSFEYFYTDFLARYIRPDYIGKFQKTYIEEYNWENSDVKVINGHFLALKGDYEKNYCGQKWMA